MSDRKFTLTDKQKQLCHELTMEYLRQNESLKMNRPNADGTIPKNAGERVRKIYFTAYQDIAIGIYENWDKIQGELYLD